MYVFLRFPGFRDMAITLSYDDGAADDKRLLEIMRAYGMKGTFNLNSKRLECAPYEIADLYEGMEIAAHGYDHMPATEYSSDVAAYDVIKDREFLERKTGKIVRGYAYPNGAYNSESIKLLRSLGIEYARTTDATHGFDLPSDFMMWHPTCHHNDSRLTELTDAFLGKEKHWYYMGNAPRLLYVWGHSFEFPRDNNWNVIEDFCKKAGGRDDVWYAANGEIYSYVMAYNALRFSADKRLIHNPTATDVYLNYMDKEVLVRAGETVIAD